MTRRIASILITALALAALLGGAASASAKPKSSKHHSCPTAKARRAHHARSRRCRANRHIRHSARNSIDSSTGLVVGLNASVAGWSTMSARLDQVLSASGTKWLREQFEWSQIEPAPGTFDFSRYDQYMLLTAQRGVHVLPLLFDAPSWAGAAWNAIPADPSAYAAFVAAVVGRYGPNGTFWAAHPALAGYAIQTFELWNEPYYDNGDNGDYDPGRYARLVKAAAIAGRQADPAARFLLAAENQSQLVGSDWTWWIGAMYQAVPDLNNYFDGIAVHPYGTNLTNLSFPRAGQAYDGYDQIRRVQAIHQEFAVHNAANKPLWVTEIGWPTCTSGSPRCTTTAGQAAKLTTVFNYAHTSWKNFVHAVFVYTYDDASPDSSNPENDYGLTYNNGSPKPALAVFKAQATG
ncbi:MAG: beta-galactosidase [Solirubrobacterales bacterium]|nr:beta-galactosidase [Solirubrobacterales bacterium]